MRCETLYPWAAYALMSLSASPIEFRTLERALPYSPTGRLANRFPCHAHRSCQLHRAVFVGAHMVQTGIQRTFGSKLRLILGEALKTRPTVFSLEWA
jgi:hypothetical protein